MENTVRRPLFFEFFGLPGCGKSTVSHAIAMLLRENGYSVKEPSYRIDHQKRIIKRLLKFAIVCWWYLFHHKEYCSIRNIVRLNDYMGLEELLQISNIIQKVRIYNNKVNSHIFIWDQGLVQAAISLSIKGAVSAGENYNNLKLLIRRDVMMVPIYMPVAIDVALKRMSERPTNDSRVEELVVHEQKVALLKRYQEGIDSIGSLFAGGLDSIVVNDIVDLDEKVNVVYNEMMKTVKENVFV